MTVRQVLAGHTSRELSEWWLYYRRHGQQRVEASLEKEAVAGVRTVQAKNRRKR